MANNVGGAFLPNADYALTGALDLSGVTSLTFPGGAVTSLVTNVASSPTVQTNEFLSKLTLTGTTTTATSGLNAIRGEVNLGTGKTFSGTSFLAGVYGRGNIFGTVDIGSGDLAAVYAKFDLNGSTLTSGHIAPLQANIVNPGATAAATTDLIYAESASGTKIKSILSGYAAADYAFDLTDVGAVFFVATAGAAATKYLRIKCNGTAYKIALLADS